MSEKDVTEREGQIPTNLRLLAILEEVAKSDAPVIPATVGKVVGLPKPTVHRLFQTAEAEGFLQRDLDGKSYGPGPRMRDLAVHVMSSRHMRTARVSILKAVAEEIGETCNLSTPDREGMIYLDRVETHWPLRIQLPVGTQVPFHCTASGKMYLATMKPAMLEGYLSAKPLTPVTRHSITDPDEMRLALDQIRKLGYSTDHEEFMEGMVAVAVPVLDDRDRLVATISIHAPILRHRVETLLDALPALRAASRILTKLNQG